MAPMLKRRRILDGPTVASRRTIDISSFGRVTKANTIHTKDLPDSDSDTERKHKPAHRAMKSNKRQRDEEPLEGLREQPGNIIRVAAQTKDEKLTPKKKVRFSAVEGVTQTTVQRSCERIQDIAISEVKIEEDAFDQETQNLINLHTAMLNALAIHYAHHETASPLDIKALIPRIELKWGVRRLVVEDIQRVLGIQHTTSPSALSLAQRDTARICIEYDPNASTPLPVETLKTAFVTAIQRLQSSRTPYPLEEIQEYSAPTYTSLSKGASRLADIKAAAISAQPSQTQTLPSISSSGTDSITPTQSDSSPSSRAISLLDRIRNKESLASSGPAPPTVETLARRAALQRLEEIIPILEVLSGSSNTVSSRNLYSSRATSLAGLDSLTSSLGLEGLRLGSSAPTKVVSLTMGAVVQHLQGSMRHPISREEVERAVRLVADEVAPRWIGVRELGSVVGVTFRGRMGRAEWSARVRQLLENC